MVPRPKTRYDAVPRQTPDEDVVFIGFKLSESMARDLDELTAQRSSNRSVLIREAIDAYLTAQEVAATA